MKTHQLAAPGRSAGVRFRRRRRGTGRARRACSPPVAICRRRGCWRPTRAASFRGIRRGSRCCGGRRIRARCCFPREFHCSRSLRDDSCAVDASSVTDEPAFRGRDRGLRRSARPAGRAPGSPPRCSAAYCELHRRGIAHSVEVWLRRRSWSAGSTACAAGGCSAANPCSACERRCLQGGAGVAGAACCEAAASSSSTARCPRRTCAASAAAACPGRSS